MTGKAELEFLISDSVTALANFTHLVEILEKPNAREALIAEGLTADYLPALVEQAKEKPVPQ